MADSSFLALLVEQGFPRERAEKALQETRNASVEAAVDWLVIHAEDPDMGTAEPTNLAELHRAKQAAKSAEEALAEAKVREAMAQMEEEKRREEEARRTENLKIQEFLSRKPGKKEDQEDVARFEEKVRQQEAAERERLKAMTRAVHDATLLQFEADRRARADRDERERQKRIEKEEAERQRLEEMKKRAQIQIRLFDGSSVRESFAPSDTLFTVKEFVDRKLAEAAAPPPPPPPSAKSQPDSDGEDGSVGAEDSDDDEGAPGRWGKRGSKKSTEMPGTGYTLSGSAPRPSDTAGAPGEYTFLSVFPRKEYTKTEFGRTLQDLGFFPGGASLSLKRL